MSSSSGAIASDNTDHSGQTSHIPIAQLTPLLSAPASRSIKAVVTLTWPYSSATGSVAFLLSEPDFRLRRTRGQVRVQFSGSSAKAVSQAGIASGDEIVLSLDGVKFVHDVEASASTPGRGVEFELKFAERLVVEFHPEGSRETKKIDIDHPSPEPEAIPARLPTPKSSLSPLQPTQILTNEASSILADDEWSSPALIKRARTSYGSLYDSDYDPFAEEDGSIRGQRRKRTRLSSSWRYNSRSPTPESDDQIMEPLGVQESTSTNPATMMTDEACQTLALDEGTAAEALATFSQQPINTENSSYFAIHNATPEEVEGDQDTVSATQPIPPMIRATNGDELYQEAVEAENDPSSPRLHPTQSDSLTLVSPIIHLRPEPSESTTFQNQVEYGPNSSSEPAVEDSAIVDVARVAEDLYNASPDGADDAPTDDFTEEQGPTTASDAGMPPFTGSYLPEDQYGHWQTANAQFNESNPHYVATEQLPEGQYYEQQSQEMQYDDLSGYQAETEYPPLEEESQDNGPSDWSFQPREVGYPDLPPTYGSREGSLKPPPPRSIAMSRSQSVELEQIDPTEDSDDEFPQLEQESPLDKEMDAEFDEEESEEGEYPEDEYDVDENGNPVLGPGEGSELDNEGEASEPDDSHYDEQELEEESDDEDGEDAESYTKKPPSVIDLLSSDDEEVAPSQAQLTKPLAFQASSGSDHNNDPIEYPSEDDEDDEDEEDGEDRDDASDEEGEEGEDDEEEKDDEQDEEEEEDREEEEVEGVAKAAEAAELDEEDEFDAQIPVLGHSASENDNPDTLLDERKSKETPKRNGMEDVSETESQPVQTVERQSRQALHLVNALVEEAEVSEKEDEAIQDAMELDEQNSVAEIAVLNSVSTISKSQKPQPGGSFPFARQLSMDGASDDIEVLNPVFAKYKGSDVMVEDRDPFTEILEPQVPKQDNYQLPTPADTQLSGKLLSAEPSFNSIASELVPEWEQSTTLAGIQSEVEIHEEVDAFETTAETAEEENMIEEQIHREIEVSQTAMFEEHTPGDLGIADVATVFPAEPFLPVSPVEESVEEVKASAPPHEDPEKPEPIVEITQEETAITPSISGSPLHENNEKKLEIVEVTEEVTAMGIQSPPAPDTLLQNQDPEISSANEGTPGEQHTTDTIEPIHNSESILIEEPPEVIGLTDHVIEALSEQGGPSRQDVFHDEPALNPTTLQHKGGPVGTVSEEHELIADGPRRSARRPKPATNAINQIENARPVTPNRTTRSVETSSGLKNETSPAIVLDSQRTPEGHDASVELALAATDSPSKRDLQGSPMADVRLRLTRALRTELPQFTPLKKLRYSIGKKIDVLGVATTSPPEPQRAKSGPRQYSVVFNVTDASIAPSGVAEIQVFRPYKDALPAIEIGDGILLRNFQVVSVQKGFALRSLQDEGSSWAVFKGDEEPEIRGPPVEYGDEEKGHVKSLKAWFSGLDYVSLAKISRANGDKVPGKGIGKA